MSRAEDVAGRAVLNRTPPVLAVEVAGRDEGEAELRDKATWYLRHGVAAVWLVFPNARRVLVLDGTGESAHGPTDRMREHLSLPGLAPQVAELFAAL